MNCHKCRAFCTSEFETRELNTSLQIVTRKVSLRIDMGQDSVMFVRSRSTWGRTSKPFANLPAEDDREAKGEISRENCSMTLPKVNHLAAISASPWNPLIYLGLVSLSMKLDLPL